MVLASHLSSKNLPTCIELLLKVDPKNQAERLSLLEVVLNLIVSFMQRLETLSWSQSRESKLSLPFGLWMNTWHKCS